ncbi:hypothetical protein B0H14DRAFT_2585816 [Mycena olivaceomarginata]|nr:hypothetical protein B0H14DRAFT_2585816 [Mycena olivaceomarginata]
MSVHHRRLPSTPVSSPTRATDELLELTQQMTPSKPPDVLRRLRCDLQSHANNIRDDITYYSQTPAAKTIEKMYKIKFSMLGAIVNASILAIWLHSADTQLTEIGDETGINYSERHSYYMQRIVEALASKKAWALDLVAYWDRILFPDADAPQSTLAGDRRLEDAEDDDDFFDSVPVVESPARPRIGWPP